MNRLNVNPRLVTALRWTARGWSLLLLVIAVLMMIVPDPNAVEPVSVGEVIVLGMWGASVAGLLLAWRWEGLGAVIAIAGVLGHAVGFRILVGYWYPDLISVAIPFIVFVLPALLYLICRALSPLTRKASEIR